VRTRCTAPNKNLDGGVSIRRCREHNDVLVKEEELGTLWDNYGLVGDVVVNIFCCSFYYPSFTRTNTIGMWVWTHFVANMLHYVYPTLLSLAVQPARDIIDQVRLLAQTQSPCNHLCATCISDATARSSITSPAVPEVTLFLLASISSESRRWVSSKCNSSSHFQLTAPQGIPCLYNTLVGRGPQTTCGFNRARVCTSPFDTMMLPETMQAHAGLQTARDAECRILAAAHYGVQHP
jgi:hypothetical protein